MRATARRHTTRPVLVHVGATFLAAALAAAIACSEPSLGPTLSPLGSKTAASAEKSSTFSAWSEPVNLGYVVNAKGFRSITPGIAPGGLSLYFASRRTNVPRDFNLYVTQRVSREAPWGPPRTLGPNLFTPGAGFANRSPSLTPDGEHLFFNTLRPNGCGNFDLWVSSREDTSDDFSWGVPVSLGCVINSPSLDEASSYFKDQETGVASLYFSSDRGGPVGRFQIYVSTQQDDGTWGPAVPVPEFNSPYSSDNCPNIRADGLEFYFCSNRPPRVGTSGFEVDLWVSTRATTRDPWSPPVPVVGDAAFPSISADGTELYMIRQQPGTNGFHAGDPGYIQDLYVSTRHRIGERGGRDEPDGERGEVAETRGVLK